MNMRRRMIGLFALGLLVSGCEYEGPLSGVSCEVDEECPYSAPCVEGWCDLGSGPEMPDASGKDMSGDVDVDSDVDGDISEDQCGEGLDLCQEQCVDLEEDSDHCGECGNSCRSGVCGAGICEVFTCEAGAEPFGGGLGTADEPYTICTAEHLSRVGNYLESDFVLSDHIDMTGFDMAQFEIIGKFEEGANTPFQGRFDGYGLEIRNLRMNAYEGAGAEGDNQVALFGYVGPAGSVENLRLVNIDVEGKDWVSGLVLLNEGGITNCEVSGRVHSDGTISGGLVGTNIGEVLNSSVDMNVEGGSLSGGLVGINNGDAIISESQFNGEMVGQITDIGGLVGANYGSIERCDGFGGVGGNGDRYGGLVGTNSGEISFSSAQGAVSTTTNEIGGLVGENQETGTIAESHATGRVEGNESIGGLVGRNFGEISGSYAEGDVSATNIFSGGLVGDNPGGISQSYALGNVSSDSGRTGGLVGRNDGEISQSYAAGDVSSESERVGGLVGYLRSAGTVYDSYATGMVASTAGEVGGLAGRYRGEMQRCYAFGAASSEGGSLGGLVGDTSSTVIYSYWNVDQTGGEEGGQEGTPLTEDEFSAEGSFPEWDFDEVWRMSVPLGRPVLQWQIDFDL